MLCEQGDTQAEDRHEAFISCGLISRVQRLQVFSKSEKLKLLLMGAVLLEGSNEATLSLEDFVTGEKITSTALICPSNNSGLIGALKNLQTILQIVFSDEYKECLAPFIEKLEGGDQAVGIGFVRPSQIFCRVNFEKGVSYYPVRENHSIIRSER